jgi:hypothetical protein
MHLRKNFALTAGAAALATLAACSEPIAPTRHDIPSLDPAASTVMATCKVDVKALTMTCDETRPLSNTPGRATVILGGQDSYLKLASSGTTYNTGTEIFSSDVTVQNLVKRIIGTTDGFTVSGVKVFFQSGPTVTGGTGIVTVANPDGNDTFTGAGQPYFLYNQMIDSYEISSARKWQFSVPSTVSTFTFAVLVQTSMADESVSFLDRVWSGAADSLWTNAANWSGGVPVDSSTVGVPPASMLGSGSMPALTGNVTVLNLRVAAASSLHLGGFTMTVGKNLDATGTISNGIVRMTGSSALLGGNVDKLEISGAAKLQRATNASGAVSITGSLNAPDRALTISIQ